MPEKLHALAEELGATAATADAMDTASINSAVRQAGPRLAGLAYCIGSIVLKPLKRATEADFVDTFRLNAVGAAFAIAAAGPALEAAPGGGIVLFSTVAARAGFASHAVIAAAKGAVEALTVSLAAELAPHTRVNCIAPSLMRTGIAEPMTKNDAMATAIAAHHPHPAPGRSGRRRRTRRLPVCRTRRDVDHGAGLRRRWRPFDRPRAGMILRVVLGDQCSAGLSALCRSLIRPTTSC